MMPIRQLLNLVLAPWGREGHFFPSTWYDLCRPSSWVSLDFHWHTMHLMALSWHTTMVGHGNALWHCHGCHGFPRRYPMALLSVMAAHGISLGSRGLLRTFAGFHGTATMAQFHGTAMDFDWPATNCHGTDCHGIAMKMPSGSGMKMLHGTAMALPLTFYDIPGGMSWPCPVPAISGSWQCHEGT